MTFIKGADISFVDEIEAEGGAFYENGIKRDVLDILKDNGVNAARLRVWNNPQFNYCNPEKTIMMGKRIKEKGLHFLLDFHYSDYWADQGKQHKPIAWEQLTFTQLVDAVEDFTSSLISQLIAQGAKPDMVQVGNEITNGMIWGEGRVDGEFNTPEQWAKLAALIAAGIRGVHKATTPDEERIPVMLHIDRGGDNESSRYFYDKLASLQIEFDVIGLSFYSWWHGTLDQFTDNINDLAQRYNKPINVVEVAYPWTLTPPDEKPLIFNSEDLLHEGFPATVEGQKQWLLELIKRIKAVPNGLGVGLYYWEPCWIPSKPTWSVGHENNWSNLTMFDYNGKLLSSFDAYREG